jgi:cell fate (sporulation/competence/biofilm development) regulator YlbF (YheA/YmcA/DUF963 family)
LPHGGVIVEVIEKARELGLAIMEDERCKRFQAAKTANDSDAELQSMIGEFNLKKLQLNNEFNKDPEQQSKEKLTQIEGELKRIYGKVMSNKSMAEFTQAKKDMDELVGHINSIIQMSITGEVSEDGCEGNCASCAGCH